MQFPLDARFLDKFEQFSHWTQRTFHFGMDCFFFARLSVSLLVAFSYFYRFRSLSSVTLLILLFISIISIWFINKVERTATQMLQKQSLNPYRQMGIIRLAILFLECSYLARHTINLLYGKIAFNSYVMEIIFGSLIVAAIYFSCCTPLPPAKQESKKTSSPQSIPIPTEK